MRFCRFNSDSDNVVRYRPDRTTAAQGVIRRTLDHLPAGESRLRDAAMRLIFPLTSVRLLAPVNALQDRLHWPQLSRARQRIESSHSHRAADLPQAALGSARARRTILRPTTLSQRVDHEGELGVVIGKRCHGLRESDDVREFILGYTCVNDVTARDLQNKDGQWSRAKGFDTFCPIRPQSWFPGSIPGAECAYRPASMASFIRMERPRTSFFLWM